MGIVGRPFEKGVSGNKAGRPKGAKNKVGAEGKKIIEKYCSDYEKEGLMNDIADLSPKERVNVYLELIQYTRPKLRAVDVSAKVDNEISVKQTMYEKLSEQYKYSQMIAAPNDIQESAVSDPIRIGLEESGD